MKRQLFYALAAMAAFLPVSCASTSKAGADSTSPFEKVDLNGSEVPYTVLAKTNAAWKFKTADTAQTRATIQRIQVYFI